MRVFVTGTGRCGTVSFSVACKFADNYTVGHESRNGLLCYPDNHIEVSAHMRCCISHLALKYPDAKWVHLVRAPEPCIKSLSNLDDGLVMRAYETLYETVCPGRNPSDIAYRYYWSEKDSIDAQLEARVSNDRRITMQLESIKDEWHRFWDWAGLSGDFAASLASWDVPHNTTEQRTKGS